MEELLKSNSAEQVVPPIAHGASVEVKKEFERFLETDSYEEVSTELSKVEDWQKFRQTLATESFGSFFEIFEELTLYNKYIKSTEEKKSRVQVFLGQIAGKANIFSPRVADMYLSIVREFGGHSYETQFSANNIALDNLRENAVFIDLSAADTSWDFKLNRIEKGLLPHLKIMRDRDKRE